MCEAQVAVFSTGIPPLVSPKLQQAGTYYIFLMLMPFSNKESTIDLQRKDIYSVLLCIYRGLVPEHLAYYSIYALLSQNTLLHGIHISVFTIGILFVLLKKKKSGLMEQFSCEMRRCAWLWW